MNEPTTKAKDLSRAGVPDHAARDSSAVKEYLRQTCMLVSNDYHVCSSSVITQPPSYSAPDLKRRFYGSPALRRK